uniref:Uncharacterized protein n=1 Tax=Vitrella brassicaformis TaxID=1169539 RepID=A0A7S1KC06_9ALVE
MRTQPIGRTLTLTATLTFTQSRAEIEDSSAGLSGCLSVWGKGHVCGCVWVCGFVRCMALPPCGEIPGRLLGAGGEMATNGQAGHQFFLMCICVCGWWVV